MSVVTGHTCERRSPAACHPQLEDGTEGSPGNAGLKRTLLVGSHKRHPVSSVVPRGRMRGRVWHQDGPGKQGGLGRETELAVSFKDTENCCSLWRPKEAQDSLPDR